MHWRRRRPERDPGPAAGRTLTDDETHRIALGVLIAAAYVGDSPDVVARAEGEIRMLLADLGPADLVEICGDVAAFGVVSFKISDAAWGPERVRHAMQHLAFRHATAQR